MTIEIAGIALVVIGIGLISPPLALIVAGIAMFAYANKPEGD